MFFLRIITILIALVMASTKCISLSIFYHLDSCGKLIQDAICPLVKEQFVRDNLEDVLLCFNANRGNNIRLILRSDGDPKALVSFIDSYLKSYLAEYPSLDEKTDEDPIHLFSNYPNNSIQYNHFMVPSITCRDVHAANLFDQFPILLSKVIIELDFRLVSNVRVFIDQFSALCYRSIGEIVLQNELERKEIYKTMMANRFVFDPLHVPEFQDLSIIQCGVGVVNPIELGGHIVKSFLKGFDDMENIRTEFGSLKMARQLCEMVSYHLGGMR